MKAAIIGLGIIGLEWAKHLENDGLLSACWNRTSKISAPKFTGELSDIPKQAEIIQIVVADPSAVSGILKTILPYLSSRHLIIQSSTIDPDSSERFAAAVREMEAGYLEAPFTGSLPAAQKRELVFYVGGEKSEVERARSYLAGLSKSIFHIGTGRQACTLKLVMNLQIASALEALAEALSIARKAGINDNIFFDAFRLNASFSGVAALKEQKLKSNDFSPQFSIKHMGKDMRLLKNSLEGEGLPILNQISELFDLAGKQGLSDEDFSALIKLR